MTNNLPFVRKKKFLVSYISPVVVYIALKEFQIVIVRIFFSLVSLLCACVCRRIIPNSEANKDSDSGPSLLTSERQYIVALVENRLFADVSRAHCVPVLCSNIISAARRQKGLTGYCFKYIDRPFCLRTGDLLSEVLF